MTEQQITKNQHYVPQFYLRKFQNTENKVEVLSCKHNKLFSPSSTKSICFKKFYYGLETGTNDNISQAVEDVFKRLETNLAKEIPAIEKKLLEGGHIERGEKWIIGFLMSMLWIRGPVMREQNRRMVEDITQQMMGFTFSMPDDRIKSFFDVFDKNTSRTTTPKMREKIKESFLKKDYKLEIDNVVHISMFANIHNFANLFAGQDWFVYISKAKSGFITSDNPVAEFFPERKSFYGASFLEREHYFALSPEIIIHCKYPNEKNRKELRRKTYFDNDKDKILFLNLKLAYCALNFIYSKDKEPLNEILKIAEIHKKQQYKLLKSEARPTDESE